MHPLFFCAAARYRYRDMAFMDGFSNIHVVGAGGIGVSAVARLLARRGKTVTGSDGAESEITRGLADVGVNVAIGADAAHVPADADLLLYSTAVPDAHPERAAATVRGIRQVSYPEFLGELTKEYKTICVSGTNGKSTTTAMLGLMLERAGFDPTVIVGSKVTSFPDGNLRVGKSEWLVLEACEYQAHLLHYSPWAIVITNIEEDHLDYFRDLAHIRDVFQEYVRKLPKDGLLVLNADDAVSAAELKPKVKPIFFSMHAPAEYMAQDVRVADGFQHFSVMRRGGTSVGNFALGVPGEFNVMNALAAASMALALGIPPAAVRDTLRAFTGIWRRFERVGEKDGVIVVSDYGHHHTAVAGTIAAARAFYPGRRIVLAFQPHHRNRTRKLFKEFVESFDGADVLLLAEIYDVAGRDDADDARVSSASLVDAVRARDAQQGVQRDVAFTGPVADTFDEIERRKAAGDVILLMGAGDIYTLAKKLV